MSLSLSTGTWVIENRTDFSVSTSYARSISIFSSLVFPHLTFTTDIFLSKNILSATASDQMESSVKIKNFINNETNNFKAKAQDSD